MRTSTKKILLLPLIGVLLLSSCVKVDTYHTYHPNDGKIILDIDWDEVELPNVDDDLSIIIGGDTITIKEGEEPSKEILRPPGKEEIIVINNPDGTTLDKDGVIHVDTDEDGNIIPNPGVVIGDYEEIIVEGDKEIIVPIKPKQLTRELNIVVKVSSIDATRIKTLSGSLSNIARSYDLKADKEINAGTVTFDFIKAIDFSTKMNLFGIIDTPQTLTLFIEYSNGTSEAITSDVSSLLKDFNLDKKNPLTITTTIELDEESGFEAIIKPWTKENGGSGVAN